MIGQSVSSSDHFEFWSTCHHPINWCFFRNYLAAHWSSFPGRSFWTSSIYRWGKRLICTPRFAVVGECSFDGAKEHSRMPARLLASSSSDILIFCSGCFGLLLPRPSSTKQQSPRRLSFPLLTACLSHYYNTITYVVCTLRLEGDLQFHYCLLTTCLFSVCWLFSSLFFLNFSPPTNRLFFENLLFFGVMEMCIFWLDRILFSLIFL